jgi:hypothetical protein
MEGSEISEGDADEGRREKGERWTEEDASLSHPSLRKIREDTANGAKNTAALFMFFIFRIIA